MIKRRELLTRLSLAGGGAVLGLGSQAVGVGDETGNALSDRGGNPASGWRYSALEPEEIARRVYSIYPDGGCAYALFGSVIQTLAEREGEPFRSFPLGMMRFGEGGVGGWGGTCGVVTGAAALFGLFHNGKETRENLIHEFSRWYETTALPRYIPAGTEKPTSVKTSAAGSVLCHLSLRQWCESSGASPYSPEKRERCRRLTADGVKKTVLLLNRAASDEKVIQTLASSSASCTACHGPKERSDAFGKMNCAPCQTLPDDHPKTE